MKLKQLLIEFSAMTNISISPQNEKGEVEIKVDNLTANCYSQGGFVVLFSALSPLSDNKLEREDSLKRLLSLSWNQNIHHEESLHLDDEYLTLTAYKKITNEQLDVSLFCNIVESFFNSIEYLNENITTNQRVIPQHVMTRR